MFSLKITRRLDGHWVYYLDGGPGTLARQPFKSHFNPDGVLGVDPDAIRKVRARWTAQML